MIICLDPLTDGRAPALNISPSSPRPLNQALYLCTIKESREVDEEKIGGKKDGTGRGLDGRKAGRKEDKKEGRKNNQR